LAPESPVGELREDNMDIIVFFMRRTEFTVCKWDVGFGSEAADVGDVRSGDVGADMRAGGVYEITDLCRG
jgi:hypothetical protein